MKATFENSVSVLVRAYLNDTLQGGNCYACAVGNLVADANGYKYVPCSSALSDALALDVNHGRYESSNGDLDGGNWHSVISWKLNHMTIQEKGNKEIESIGYTVEEVTRIEAAFEDTQVWVDETFNALLAVVDVLAEIHGVDLTAKENAIGQFQKVKSEKQPA